MVNVNICLAVDSDVRVSVGSISQIVQRKDYRAIGGVLKGYNASLNMAILNLVKDIYAGWDQQTVRPSGKTVKCRKKPGTYRL